MSWKELNNYLLKNISHVGQNLAIISIISFIITMIVLIYFTTYKKYDKIFKNEFINFIYGFILYLTIFCFSVILYSFLPEHNTLIKAYSYSLNHPDSQNQKINKFLNKYSIKEVTNLKTKNLLEKTSDYKINIKNKSHIDLIKDGEIVQSFDNLTIEENYDNEFTKENFKNSKNDYNKLETIKIIESDTTTKYSYKNKSYIENKHQVIAYINYSFIDESEEYAEVVDYGAI